eukprot:3934935-Ditylum_brightwellii.AAC.1
MLQRNPPAVFNETTRHATEALYKDEPAGGYLNIVLDTAIDLSMSNLPYSAEQAAKHFQSIATGKGAGPYSGITDVIHNIALHKGSE